MVDKKVLLKGWQMFEIRADLLLYINAMLLLMLLLMLMMCYCKQMWRTCRTLERHQNWQITREDRTLWKAVNI